MKKRISVKWEILITGSWIISLLLLIILKKVGVITLSVGLVTLIGTCISIIMLALLLVVLFYRSEQGTPLEDFSQWN